MFRCLVFVFFVSFFFNLLAYHNLAHGISSSSMANKSASTINLSMKNKIEKKFALKVNQKIMIARRASNAFGSQAIKRGGEKKSKGKEGAVDSNTVPKPAPSTSEKTSSNKSPDAKSIVCKAITSKDREKIKFCFFSLNNPEESTTFLKGYKKYDVEIEEFYGDQMSGQNIEEAFKKMTQKSECDALIISGHHTGEFYGEQNSEMSLSLDFLEKMSCEVGCMDWFSNVKSLFLQGCRTVEPKLNWKVKNQCKKNMSQADCNAAYIAIQYSIEGSERHQNLNQTYSSVLDKKTNPLSSRYLRMFPESSVYGWSDSSPTAKQGANESLPNFINKVKDLMEEGGTKKRDSFAEVKGVVKMIEASNNIVLYNEEQCMQARKELLAIGWAEHQENKETNPTACYISDNKDAFIENRKRGCELQKTEESGNKDKINKAIDNILSSPDSIKANFNRLLALVIGHKDKTEKPDWYDAVIKKLKKESDLKEVLKQQLLSDEIGFVKKADYLYFYSEMGWTSERSKISEIFLSQLLASFKAIETMDLNNENKTPAMIGDRAKVNEAYQVSIFHSIDQNGVAEDLKKNAPDEFAELVELYKDSQFAEKRYAHFLNYIANKNSVNATTQIKEADQFFDLLVDKASGIDEKFLIHHICKRRPKKIPSNFKNFDFICKK